MWNFFLSSHWKSVVNGNGGTKKGEMKKPERCFSIHHEETPSVASLLTSNVHVKCISLEEIMYNSTILHQFKEKNPLSN